MKKVCLQVDCQKKGPLCDMCTSLHQKHNIRELKQYLTEQINNSVQTQILNKLEQIKFQFNNMISKQQIDINKIDDKKRIELARELQKNKMPDVLFQNKLTDLIHRDQISDTPYMNQYLQHLHIFTTDMCKLFDQLPKQIPHVPLSPQNSARSNRSKEPIFHLRSGKDSSLSPLKKQLQQRDLSPVGAYSSKVKNYFTEVDSSKSSSRQFHMKQSVESVQKFIPEDVRSLPVDALKQEIFFSPPSEVKQSAFDKMKQPNEDLFLQPQNYATLNPTQGFPSGQFMIGDQQLSKMVDYEMPVDKSYKSEISGKSQQKLKSESYFAQKEDFQYADVQDKPQQYSFTPPTNDYTLKQPFSKSQFQESNPKDNVSIQKIQSQVIYNPSLNLDLKQLNNPMQASVKKDILYSQTIDPRINQSNNLDTSALSAKSVMRVKIKRTPDLLSPFTITRTTWKKAHSRAIKSIDTFGDNIVSGSNDSSIIIWHKLEQKPRITLQGHTDQVYQVLYHEREHMILSCSADRSVIIWRPQREWKQVGKITGHTDRIRCVAVYDNMIVSGSDDTTVRFWNIKDYQYISMLKTNGRVNALLSEQDNLIVANGKYVTIFNNQDKLTETEAHSNLVLCLVGAFDTNKKGLLFSGGKDQKINLMEYPSLSIICTVLEDYPVQCLAFNLPFPYLIAGLIGHEGEGKITLWKVGESFEKVQEICDNGFGVYGIILQGQILYTAHNNKRIESWNLS